MLLERGVLLNNRYRIVEILGQGGMASVYKAVDENLGVEVAVKDNLFTTEEYARQFRREAVILATLRHPNLPRVTDHFVIEGQGQYLVMDYIEGEDLRQRMDRVGLISEDEIIIIGAAICDALTYLSNCNPPIVHRDIKPGNVRITPNGHIYLVDFGLAKDLGNQQVTTTGARAMTPGYSPPEQYGTARTDTRSDIYSLGATLYAGLTGNIPEDALSRAVDHIPLTPIRKYNPRVSRKLAAAIEKAMDIRPDGRYQTAEEFKQALLNSSSPSRRSVDEYVVTPPPTLEDKPLPVDNVFVPADVAARLPRASVQPLPVSSGAKKPSTPRPRQNGSRPNRRLFWWLILIALIALIGSIGFYAMRFPSAMQPYWRLAQDSGIIPPFIMDRGILASLVPAATSTSDMLVVVPEDVTTTPSIFPGLSTNTPTFTATPTPTITQTSTPTPTTTATSTPTMTQTPIPTPVGGGQGQIAFASDRETGAPQIWLVNIDGTNPRRLTDIGGGACQPAWSPDGRSLIFISPCDRNKEAYPGSAMFLIPNVDAESIEIIPLPFQNGGDYDPAWSPDGNTIVFTSERDTGRPRIFTLNIGDKSVIPQTALFTRSFQPAWSPDGKQITFVVDEGIRRIFVVEVNLQGQNSNEPVRITGSEEFSDLSPTWSPDGQVILFTRYPIAGGTPRLVAKSYKGEQENGADNVVFTIKIGTVPIREAKYSPDGFWLVFETWPDGGNHEIAIMRSNSSEFRIIAAHPFNDFDPAWRPVVR